MKKIFRSIINIKKGIEPTIPYDALIGNYKSFLASKVQPEEPSYIEMYSWIEAHYREHKEIISFELLYDKAVTQGKEAILANLKDISEQIPYTRADYKAILKEKYQEQSIEKFRDIVQKTYQAASSGLKIKKDKEVKGVYQAIEYFMAEARDFRISETGLKTESDILSVEDSKEVITEYEARKRDPLSKLGMFSKIQKIDDSFKGLKLGKLLIIAAFVAQGKSTFTAALIYQAITQGLNGLFLSLEMTFNEMRDMFYVLHTTNEEWFDHPVYKKRFKDLVGRISYEKVRYGELSEKEEEFFRIAADDFSSKALSNDAGGKFGKLILVQPANALTPSMLEMEVEDRKSQMADMGRQLDFATIDYIGLMVQDKSERYGDYNIDLNNIIKKLKNLALTFDNGRGLMVITPFQVNREGWKDAAKNEGVYKLTALSSANEAERSADYVISLFMSDENKKNGIMKITCLKHRDGSDFNPFEVHIDFNSKRIYDIIQKDTKSGPDDGMGFKDISELTSDILG